MRDHRTVSFVLTVLGGVAAIAGAFVAWFWVDPRFDPLGTTLPSAYTTLAETGIHGIDLLVLAAVGLVLCLHVLRPMNNLSTISAVLTGSALVLGCLYYPFAASWIGFQAMVEPTIGWYLTLLGGLLLLASGALRLHDTHSPSTAA